MNEQINLTNCDREPIHIPGSVQPFGFLLGLVSNFSIALASDKPSELGIPFIFATGYGERGPIPPEPAAAPLIQKPYTRELVEKALAKMK